MYLQIVMEIKQMWANVTCHPEEPTGIVSQILHRLLLLLPVNTSCMRYLLPVNTSCITVIVIHEVFTDKSIMYMLLECHIRTIILRVHKGQYYFQTVQNNQPALKPKRILHLQLVYGHYSSSFSLISHPNKYCLIGLINALLQHKTKNKGR